ncbi:MAG: hypothetical protein ACYTGP_11505 [Planctomycetota bacterium]
MGALEAVALDARPAVVGVGQDGEVTRLVELELRVEVRPRLGQLRRPGRGRAGAAEIPERVVRLVVHRLLTEHRAVERLAVIEQARLFRRPARELDGRDVIAGLDLGQASLELGKVRVARAGGGRGIVGGPRGRHDRQQHRDQG